MRLFNIASNSHAGISGFWFIDMSSVDCIYVRDKPSELGDFTIQMRFSNDNPSIIIYSLTEEEHNNKVLSISLDID